MLRNDDLSSASELVSEYAGDPPNSGLDPLFATSGKSVLMWSGKAWKTHMVAFYETCIFAKGIGFFLLDDFAAWYSGRTHRDHFYLAMEHEEGKSEEKCKGQPNILALVFVEKEEFDAALQWFKKIKPQDND